MFLKAFWIFVAALAVCECSLLREKSKRFPEDFLFGVATSAYQIEGAWNVDGKGPSIWDEYTHSHTERIKDHTNADVSTNSYEYFMDDIKAIKDLGMNYYRFSIAWSRLLPTGDISKVNEKGIDYYNKVIDKLLEMNIEPMITMYHWDLPLKLQKLGGFTNPAIVYYFEECANLLYKRFGDRVKYWITFNEPYVFCMDGYGGVRDAPGLNYTGIGEYLCGHNVLKAHALAYRLYEDKYYRHYRGKVGITLNSFYYYSEYLRKDNDLVNRALKFMLGWFADPIFSKNGDYPEVMINEIRKNSKREGRMYYRLPEFSREWIKKIRGSADFLGLNYYTSRYVEEIEESKLPYPSYARDRRLKEVVKTEWKRGEMEWLYSVPRGLGDILRYIKREYYNPKVFITENGWADKGELEDNDRIEYLRDHLIEVRDAIKKDKCNVRGYTAWTLMDNFEWRDGYTGKFGLYAVNMNSPRKERKPKRSVEFIQKVTKNYEVPELN